MRYGQIHDLYSSFFVSVSAQTLDFNGGSRRQASCDAFRLPTAVSAQRSHVIDITRYYCIHLLIEGFSVESATSPPLDTFTVDLCNWCLITLAYLGRKWGVNQWFYLVSAVWCIQFNTDSYNGATWRYLWVHMHIWVDPHKNRENERAMASINHRYAFIL